jgi:hypothetical protein
MLYTGNGVLEKLPEEVLYKRPYFDGTNEHSVSLLFCLILRASASPAGEQNWFRSQVY